MTVTVIIPNFNGRKLLEKNLPNILDGGADWVVILDDGSTDGSVDFLDKLKGKSQKLKIIIHKKNRGFIPSVNELFDNAIGEVVILLNNDVFVEKDFIKAVLPHFENQQVFAVNLHEEGEGPAIAFWKDGFFEFKRGEEKDIVQKSSWASGGSAVFRKSIWQELEGFDSSFAPFYWEDIDISYRAIKAGYNILWEPNSKVYHEHETTIKKLNRRYVRWVQERNQLLFIWKNIKDKNLIREHRLGLIKRLLISGPGYWIPFLWALLKWKNIYGSPIESGMTNEERSDLEAINYANS